MSGFEDYQHELTGIDAQIAHYAAICGLSLDKPVSRGEIEALLQSLPAQHGPGDARQTLQALLILRIRLETEMTELGYNPPELRLSPQASYR